MDARKTKQVLSILMESPLYMTLSLGERRSLLERLETTYPNLFNAKETAEEDVVGYASSRLGML